MAILKSLRHALEGLAHALAWERNLQLFCVVYAAILMAAYWLSITRWEWVVLVIAGGTFIGVELLNTAFERLVDSVDELSVKSKGLNYHHGLKMTKDVASAAALASFVVVLITLCAVLLPHVNQVISG